MKSFVRISALLWADALVFYAFFVMQNYLTEVWRLSFTHAAGILNIWLGISKILQVFFLFLVHSLLGNFKMLLISSIAYSLGVSFVAMSTPPVLANSTNMCKEYEPQCIGHTQKALFYTGMALVAVGMAGNHVSVQPFIEEQQDKSENYDKLQDFFKDVARVIYVPVLGAIALPHVKPWSLQFGIPAIFTTFATLHFLSGSIDYLKYKAKESPLLRCPDKAAIILPDIKLEDLLILVRMIPMWITFILHGIIFSLMNTYFIEQANHMNRKLGSWNVPLQILLLFYKLDCYYFSRFTVKTYGPRVQTAIAMILSILCCGTAAVIEKWRLNAVKNHGLLDNPEIDVPMSVFWLLFQFFFLAGLDFFFQNSVAASYEDQAPKSMKNYLLVSANAASGLGYMFSVLTVYVVGKVSERGGRRSWFQHTLNRSRLDRYYWVLAALSSAILVVLVIVGSCYRTKKRRGDEDDE